MQKLEELFLNELDNSYTEFNKRYSTDTMAIQAIADSRTKKRAHTIRDWLTRYSLFQSYSKKDRNAVVRAILQTVRAHPDLKTITSVPELRIGYARLYQAIEAAAPRCGKNGTTLRDVTSLTSKALWCCSPGFVPIFDSYALRALLVLGRLHQISCHNYANDAHRPYFEFCDIWFGLADDINASANFRAEFLANGWQHNAPPIEQAFTRSFDKFLWMMGQPKFG